ncbi:MAG: hypothetical protein N3A69_03805 [Leptospiraceae bacterium]|nr:hypothetical protein [Leptospiraceae bacterium]
MKVDQFQLCEFFDTQGKCKRELSSLQEYSITLSKTVQIPTWDALGNYLYFQEKITPGFILHFNRKPTHIERKKILETFKAYYQFAGISGEMAGFEFGENWIGSFDYLGSMLKERQRSRKEEKSYPFLTNLFPAKLKFLYESEYFSGESEIEINLKLNREQ